ncbi:MAG: type II toxin-antitoxin system HicB family antitoxin [Thermoanaerobaculia bacterium]
MTVEKIARVRPPHSFEEYRFEIRQLTRAEGGGFLISLPDLPGCISDGETIPEAVKHGKEAFQSWVSARVHDRIPVPGPSRPEGRAVEEYSGRFVQRIPRSLHAELAARSAAEGVSLNSLVLALIASGLGQIRAGVAGRADATVVAEPTAAYQTEKPPGKSPGRRGGKF